MLRTRVYKQANNGRRWFAAAAATEDGEAQWEVTNGVKKFSGKSSTPRRALQNARKAVSRRVQLAPDAV